LFDLGAPLTRRDAAAPDLLAALSLPGPSNAGPASLEVPAPDTSNASVAAAHEEPPNHLQRALAEMASHLPSGTANVASHITALNKPGPVPTPELATVGEALEHAQAGLQRFLASPRLTLPM
jgi:phospholipase C